MFLVLLLSSHAASSESTPVGFKGSCSLEGEVRFDPALTGTAQTVHAVADAKGTCEGTFTTAKGRRINLADHQARYYAESDGEQSCEAADASGWGFLRMAGRRRIDFLFAERRVLTVAPLELEGVHSGKLTGTASAGGDPVETIQSCLAEGLASSPVVIELNSDPAISG
jgi:hypothetical protein